MFYIENRTEPPRPLFSFVRLAGAVVAVGFIHSFVYFSIHNKKPHCMTWALLPNTPQTPQNIHSPVCTDTNVYRISFCYSDHSFSLETNRFFCLFILYSFQRACLGLHTQTTINVQSLTCPLTKHILPTAISEIPWTQIFRAFCLVRSKEKWQHIGKYVTFSQRVSLHFERCLSSCMQIECGACARLCALVYFKWNVYGIHAVFECIWMGFGTVHTIAYYTQRI